MSQRQTLISLHLSGHMSESIRYLSTSRLSRGVVVRHIDQLLPPDSQLLLNSLIHHLSLLDVQLTWYLWSVDVVSHQHHWSSGSNGLDRSTVGDSLYETGEISQVKEHHHRICDVQGLDGIDILRVKSASHGISDGELELSSV